MKVMDVNANIVRSERFYAASRGESRYHRGRIENMENQAEEAAPPSAPESPAEPNAQVDLGESATVEISSSQSDEGKSKKAQKSDNTLSSITIQSEIQKKLEELKRFADQMSEVAKEAPRSSQLTVLNALVKQAKLLNAYHYEQKGWSGLMKALHKAEVIALNDNAGLAEIRKALGKLKGALSALEPSLKADDGKRDKFPVIVKSQENSENSAKAEALIESVTSGGAETISVQIAGITAGVS